MTSKNEFDILLGWLSADREEAERLYMNLRQRLVYMFHFFDDREDLADEAIDRALKNIKNDKVDFSGNPVHYIFRIATYMKFEESRKKKKYQLDEAVNEPAASSEDNGFPEDLYQIIEKCLEELSAENKELFLEYTFPPEHLTAKEHREQVSQKKNISISMLRVKIYRIREILRNCADGKLKEEQ